MKKSKTILNVMLSVMMACALCGTLASCKKKSAKSDLKLGVLSFLNLSEKEYSSVAKARFEVWKEMSKDGAMEKGDFTKINPSEATVVFYDNLDSMLMALESGEISFISGLPGATVRYLCKRNDKLAPLVELEKQPAEILKEDGFSSKVWGMLANGFSFMMLDKNVALRDEFDKVILEMKKDGTIDNLLNTYIFDIMEGKDPAPIIPEFKDGRKTIKVAVTGSLPPMDYVAADGTFAGYNTAMLAEIGKRLDCNVTMVQVSSVGRATALASGTVDVVFWTRGLSEMVIAEIKKEGPENCVKNVEEKLAALPESQRNAVESYRKFLSPEQSMKKDMPANTVITMPYFTDNVMDVRLKK